MVRYVLALGSLVLLCIVLSGCGGGATATPTREPTTVPTEEQVTPTEAEVTETEVVEETAVPIEDATEEAVEGAATEALDETAESESADEGEAAAAGTLARITFTNVARTGPGTGYEEVASVPVGSELPIVAKSDGNDVWYLVTLESGENAWIWGRVMQLLPADATVDVAATIPAPPGD